MRTKSEIFNFELLVPSKVKLQESGTVFKLRMISYATLRRLSRIGKQCHTWSQVFDQTFEVSATGVCCSIERVADTRVKQLPRETAQVSTDY